jgi:hypothetical protein
MRKSGILNRGEVNMRKGGELRDKEEIGKKDLRKGGKGESGKEESGEKRGRL